ncbi:MAG: glycosyltransferase family 2 protein [Gluconacetobacter diazotrophicus]|nr:glycosyltransferase family 2 protein [Gluconacetobacter diazotrophicus]
MIRLGIGIVTYRRPDLVRGTLDAVRRFTRRPCHLVVADDGSGDDTLRQLRPLATVVTGANHGVTWNKNRALFHLRAVLHCDVVILLEDDVHPTELGWEEDWIDAVSRWGHANLAGHWFRESFVRGSGTPADPFLSRDFSGQCTAFSGEAIDYVGYLDTRYRGFGIGHVDHTRRLGRAGYGAVRDPDHNTLFQLIESPLRFVWAETARKDEDVRRNHALYQTLQHEPVFRFPWNTDAELAEFRAEQRGALQPSDAPAPDAPPPATDAPAAAAPAVAAPIPPASPPSPPSPRPAMPPVADPAAAAAVPPSKPPRPRSAKRPAPAGTAARVRTAPAS